MEIPGHVFTFPMGVVHGQKEFSPSNLSVARNLTLRFEVIFQKRVRVFHRGFKHEKTDESTRPQAECFYCFRVFETRMKHEARVFEITSPTKEN